MSIITISREFGSGGRELGKRLADELDYTYYDREIESEIAKRMNLDENYVATILEKRPPVNFPIHYGNTFLYLSTYHQQQMQTDIFAEKCKMLKEFAQKGNCVIVGRAADIILQEFNPFNIFVYADMDYKIKRCQTYAEADENLTPAELKKMIKKVDNERSKYHEMFAGKTWADKERYHLCINTSGIQIKKIVPVVADYARCWFQEQC